MSLEKQATYIKTNKLVSLIDNTTFEHYFMDKVTTCYYPGGLRWPQTGLRPSQYIPDRIGVESYHKSGLFRFLVRERP